MNGCQRECRPGSWRHFQAAAFFQSRDDYSSALLCPTEKKFCILLEYRLRRNQAAEHVSCHDLGHTCD